MGNDPFTLRETEDSKNKFKWRWWYIPVVVVIMLVIAYLLVIITLPDIESLKKINPKSTAMIEGRKQSAKQTGKKYRVHHRWVSYQAIPKLLKDAIRISEDASFFQHQGVDYDELIEAVKKNISSREYARGASTITQQLAKNLYLSTEKSIFRKIREYFITRKLEETLTKSRIFELYLNVIEFGPGIFGVQSAAQSYFHKNVSELTLAEMIRMTAVIPKPLKEHPTRNSQYVLWRSKWILHKLLRYHYIDQSVYDETLAQLIH